PPAGGPEAESAAACFRSAMPDAPPPVILTGRRGSREAFETLASGARFLHLATHAYFAPEVVPSIRDDARPRSGAGAFHFDDPNARISGFAPLVLCGLVFAG